MYKVEVADGEQLHLCNTSFLVSSEGFKAVKKLYSIVKQWLSFCYNLLIDLAGWNPGLIFYNIVKIRFKNCHGQFDGLINILLVTCKVNNNNYH